MADVLPVRAGVNTSTGKFVYTKEFAPNDDIDSNILSYDTIGNNYLVHDNISDNIDQADATISSWIAGKTLHSFYGVTENAQQLYPCNTYVVPAIETIARDTAGGWDAVNKWYVIPTTGYYAINTLMWFYPTNLGVSGRVHVTTHLLKNGIFVTSGEALTSLDLTSGDTGESVRYIDLRTLTSIEYCEAGDTIQTPWYRLALGGTTGDCSLNQNLYTDESNTLLIDLIYAP